MILLKFNNTHHYYFFKVYKNVFWRTDMTEDKEIQKSIIEQIYNEMFHTLEENDDFDKLYIEDLRKLVNSGDLKKERPVYEVLKSTEDNVNEDS